MIGSDDGNHILTPDGPEIPAVGDAPSAAASGDFLVLTLDDLLPDPQGEVVIFDDVGEQVAIATGGKPIAGQGIAEAHVTATGVDVGGFAFCTFEDGLTLYYPSSLKVIVGGDPS